MISNLINAFNNIVNRNGVIGSANVAAPFVTETVNIPSTEQNIDDQNDAPAQEVDQAKNVIDDVQEEVAEEDEVVSVIFEQV